MKAPFCRQGSKYMLIKDILDVIPKHKIYCEPFAGSAIVFFNLPKAELSILNDLDEDVYERLKLLQKAPLDITKYKNPRSISSIKETFDEPHRTIEDKIIYYKIKSCNGFNSQPITKSKEIYKPQYPYRITKDLEYYKNMLKGVQITNKDYYDVLKKYDSKDTFFFIDPPYEDTKKVFYENTNINYELLAEQLKKIKGLFLLTLNDSKNLQNIFKDFIIKKVKIPIKWKNQKNKYVYRYELFVMNYEF